jgi:hypothetical protein
VGEKVTGKDLKELRKPDQFQAVSGHALEFALAHQRQIAIGLGAVVAVALIAWGAAALKQRNETKAGQQLAEALRIASRPIAGEGIAQPGEETFPNKGDRTKAALEALEKVRKEHGSTTAAQTATLQLGLLKQQSGDPAGAVPLLDEFLKSASNTHPIRATALEALGYAHEAQGKLGEAKAAFGKLKDAGAPERGAYQLARIALIEKKPDAKDQLAAVAKEYPKDPVALEANLILEVASLPEARPATASDGEKKTR